MNVMRVPIHYNVYTYNNYKVFVIYNILIYLYTLFFWRRFDTFLSVTPRFLDVIGRYRKKMCSKTPWEKSNINYSTFMISCMPAASSRVLTCHPFCLYHINIIYVLLLRSFAIAALIYVSRRAVCTAVLGTSVILFVYKLKAMRCILYIYYYLHSRNMASLLHKHSMTLLINSW